MIKYNPDIHRRRSVRLHDYDYSQQGMYFVTICVQNRECVFGKIEANKMVLSEIGEIVRNEWLKSAELRPNVQLHDFVVMPDHFHAILEITEKCDGGSKGVARNAFTRNALAETATRPYARPTNGEKNEYMASISPKSGEFGTIIRAFKSAVTKKIHILGYDFAWQRNMWEHIIRDYADYARIADYIENNPATWDNDCLNKNESDT